MRKSTLLLAAGVEIGSVLRLRDREGYLRTGRTERR